MFHPFQNFITKAANSYGIKTEVQAAKVCHDFRTLIPEIFASKTDPEQNIEPAYFKKNILVIKVKTPAWGQEVIMRKEKIIEEMNKKAGEQIIKNLRTQL